MALHPQRELVATGGLDSLVCLAHRGTGSCFVVEYNCCATECYVHRRNVVVCRLFTGGGGAAWGGVQGRALAAMTGHTEAVESVNWASSVSYNATDKQKSHSTFLNLFTRRCCLLLLLFAQRCVVLLDLARKRYADQTHLVIAGIMDRSIFKKKKKKKKRLAGRHCTIVGRRHRDLHTHVQVRLPVMSCLSFCCCLFFTTFD
jgi:hypothetical protein